MQPASLVMVPPLLRPMMPGAGTPVPFIPEDWQNGGLGEKLIEEGGEALSDLFGRSEETKDDWKEVDLTQNATLPEDRPRRRTGKAVSYDPALHAEAFDRFIQEAKEAHGLRSFEATWVLDPRENFIVDVSRNEETGEDEILGVAEVIPTPQEHALKIRFLETVRPGSGSLRRLLTEVARRALELSKQTGDEWIVSLVSNDTAAVYYKDTFGFVARPPPGWDPAFQAMTYVLDPEGQRKLVEELARLEGTEPEP